MLSADGIKPKWDTSGRLSKRAYKKSQGGFSFLGLIWLTPQMTLDRAVLATLWTAYIFIGSRLKDARLEHYIGAAYREYESRVPGFPMMFAGPLGRRRT